MTPRRVFELNRAANPPTGSFVLFTKTIQCFTDTAMQLKLNELDWANRGRQSDKVLTGTAPESSECSSQPVIATESPERKYSPPVHDLDWALLAAAEEMKFDWPEFLPVDRKKVGIAQVAVG
jgi:hypothetical protein